MRRLNPMQSLIKCGELQLNTAKDHYLVRSARAEGDGPLA